ncbi:MAG: Stp1/IreP family PP2C-type Ser/Thr phosphatase [Myxococcales bacterium]
MSPPEIQIEVFGKTDVGLIREHNEDNLLVADLAGGFKESELEAPATLKLTERGALFLVCDGMGGAAAGEVASQMAVDAIFDVLASTEPQPRAAFARSLRRAVETANDRIFQQSRDNQNERGMGTTCTAAALNDDTLVVAQIGDSRCYVFRNGQLGQVTKDQSLAWQLIEAGAMTPEDAKAFEHANIILQALGVQDRVDVVLSQITLRRGDIVVLCSDGLHGPVVDQEIQEVLAAEKDLKAAAEGLLQRALERDGPDNITVVLARFDGPGLAEPTPDDTVGFVGYEPGRDPLSESGATVSLDAGDRDGGRVVKLDGETSARTDGTVVAPSSSETTEETGIAPGAPGKPQEQARPRTKSAAIPVVTGKQVANQSRLGFPVTARTGRSVVAFFFLALLAATTGGIFVLKCERNQATRSEGPRP